MGHHLLENMIARNLEIYGNKLMIQEHLKEYREPVRIGVAFDLFDRKFPGKLSYKTFQRLIDELIDRTCIIADDDDRYNSRFLKWQGPDLPGIEVR
jgi:hypothetical protein